MQSEVDGVPQKPSAWLVAATCYATRSGWACVGVIPHSVV